jgi:hypothetical protein
MMGCSHWGLRQAYDEFYGTPLDPDVEWYQVDEEWQIKFMLYNAQYWPGRFDHLMDAA